MIGPISDFIRDLTLAHLFRNAPERDPTVLYPRVRQYFYSVTSIVSGETLLCAAPPLIAICRPYLEPARFARQNLSVEIPFYLAQI